MAPPTEMASVLEMANVEKLTHEEGVLLAQSDINIQTHTATAGAMIKDMLEPVLKRLRGSPPT